jgi:hypothetical protein
VRNREQKLRKLERQRSAQIGTVASTSASDPDGPLVVVLTLSDKDTVQLPPNSPSIKVLNTDDCPRVRFPEEIPAEILDAYLRHYYSGKRGISPDMRSWCIQMFCELHPDAPCFGFDFI